MSSKICIPNAHYRRKGQEKYANHFHWLLPSGFVSAQISSSAPSHFLLITFCVVNLQSGQTREVTFTRECLQVEVSNAEASFSSAVLESIPETVYPSKQRHLFN